MDKKFDLGLVMATPAVLEILGTEGVKNLLDRHARGDWGEAYEDSKAMNDEAVKAQEGDLLSVYTVNGQKIWIQTYIGYSTTVMLPEEY
jgi:alkylation response protein AidB-like acyl-CoA dehydrogenase